MIKQGVKFPTPLIKSLDAESQAHYLYIQFRRLNNWQVRIQGMQPGMGFFELCFPILPIFWNWMAALPQKDYVLSFATSKPYYQKAQARALDNGSVRVQMTGPSLNRPYGASIEISNADFYQAVKNAQVHFLKAKASWTGETANTLGPLLNLKDAWLAHCNNTASDKAHLLAKEVEKDGYTVKYWCSQAECYFCGGPPAVKDMVKTMVELNKEQDHLAKFGMTWAQASKLESGDGAPKCKQCSGPWVAHDYSTCLEKED